MLPPSAAHSRDLERYLLDGERVITAVRAHWAIVSKPVAIGVLGTLLALWLDVALPNSSGRMDDIVWIAWIVLACWVAWRVFEWRHNWFVATDKRFLMFHGFVTRKVSMMPLRKVTDMTYQRSITGRLLRYGTFVLESAGQDQALSEIDYVPDPDANYRAICAEIFQIKGVDEDEELVVVPEHDDPGPPAPRRRRGDWRVSEQERWAREHEPPPEEGPRGREQSLYRSPDLVEEDRGADTGEIPVHRPRED